MLDVPPEVTAATKPVPSVETAKPPGKPSWKVPPIAVGGAADTLMIAPLASEAYTVPSLATLTPVNSCRPAAAAATSVWSSL